MGALNTGLPQPVRVGAHGDITPSTATAVAIPSGANAVLLSAITAVVTFTLDGTTPTATLGFVVDVSATILIALPSNATFTVYSASGRLQYQFLKM